MFLMFPLRVILLRQRLARLSLSTSCPAMLSLTRLMNISAPRAERREEGSGAQDWWAASYSACWCWFPLWSEPPPGCCWSTPPTLPQVDQLEHYRPSSITELYDDQGRIIGSFALQRRVVASYDDYPQVLREALISIEDKDFYRHWGINVWRIAGAAYRDIQSGGRVQGASTLTMQLARNLFLSPDRSFHRKIQEALLAVQIERRFTKASRSSPSMPTRSIWATASTDSRRHPSITSASRPSDSRSTKPRCSPACPNRHPTIRQSTIPTTP